MCLLPMGKRANVEPLERPWESPGQGEAHEMRERACSVGSVATREATTTQHGTGISVGFDGSLIFIGACTGPNPG